MKDKDIQSLYQKAILFASARHQEMDQKIPGTDLPYLVHLSNVAMEIMLACSGREDFDLGLALQAALLHDTLEDTSAGFSELEDLFGTRVAEAVQALTKNKLLSKELQMPDSLNRIRSQSREVRAVKLADRITNLQRPPAHWDPGKRISYREEARLILDELKEGNEYLADRLEGKIEAYGAYL